MRSNESEAKFEREAEQFWEESEADAVAREEQQLQQAALNL